MREQGGQGGGSGGVGLAALGGIGFGGGGPGGGRIGFGCALGEGRNGGDGQRRGAQQPAERGNSVTGLTRMGRIFVRHAAVTEKFDGRSCPVKSLYRYKFR
ncbi:hypothetical protein CQ393_09255 [Stenotrophomonas sp. MYb238]|nr:hypothetical protein [Stenotrophomonas sp. MYb238]